MAFEAAGFLPYENVYITFFSTPVFAGWVQANAAGVVSGTVAVPVGLHPGAHTLQLTGVSGFVATAAFTFVALAATGTEALPLVLVGGGLLALGAAALIIVSIRRRGGRESAEVAGQLETR
jgi:hypothetical protein